MKNNIKNKINEMNENDVIKYVKQDGYIIKYLNRSNITYMICLESVKSDGLSLKYIYEEMIDYNLCLEAVISNPFSIQYVPKKYLSTELKDQFYKSIIKTKFFDHAEYIPFFR